MEQFTVLVVQFQKSVTLEEAKKLLENLGLSIKSYWNWDAGIRYLTVHVPTEEVEQWISKILGKEGATFVKKAKKLQPK